MHHRFAPRTHRFVYRLFLLAIDLDELDALHARLRLFSHNRPNLYSWRDSDFLPVHESPHPPGAATASAPNLAGGANLKQRIIAWLAVHGIDLTGGRVQLVALPRILGYLFNPVSFYFCYNRAGASVAAIAEVTNTFGERKPFLLGPDACAQSSGGTFRFERRVPKHFYVSPFSDVDVAFDFTLRPPADRLAIQIDDYTGPERTLTSTLTGVRRELTDAALAGFAVKYPLLTLRVIWLIHWHALLLYLKKVPWFAKAARPDAQRDLYRPHHSISSSP